MAFYLNLMESKHDVFISYSRADLNKVKGIKGEIDRLAGIDCWMDLDGIETGAQFEDVIINAINRCQIVLFMMSASSMVSKWALKELDLALRKSKRIVLIAIDESQMTDKFFFRYHEYNNIKWDDQPQRNKLIKDLRKWTGRDKEDARLKAEAEARRKAEMEAKQKAEAEAKRRAEIEAKQKEEAEARRKAEIEARKKAEAETKRKAEKTIHWKEDLKSLWYIIDQNIEKFEKKHSIAFWSLLIGICVFSWGALLYDSYYPTANNIFKKGLEYHNQGDDSTAIGYFSRAAEQGNDSAQYWLGWMYEEGRGVERNDTLAVKWYRMAAEQENAAAQNGLGWMYQEGRGVDQNDTLAVKWYRMSAEHGNAFAQNNLGWMYKEGCGVAQNDTEAVKWYRLSAEQGNASGQNNLGWMYQNGRGVEQNDTLAVKWFKMAAEQGNASGQSGLGRMYEEGLGVERNNTLAVKWYRKAAEQGDEFAKKRLKAMGQ